MQGAEGLDLRIGGLGWVSDGRTGMDGWMDGDGENCISDCGLVICLSGTDKGGGGRVYDLRRRCF